jgi:hypothetical protein
MSPNEEDVVKVPPPDKRCDGAGFKYEFFKNRHEDYGI